MIYTPVISNYMYMHTYVREILVNTLVKEQEQFSPLSSTSYVLVSKLTEEGLTIQGHVITTFKSSDLSRLRVGG